MDFIIQVSGYKKKPWKIALKLVFTYRLDDLFLFLIELKIGTNPKTNDCIIRKTF